MDSAPSTSRRSLRVLLARGFAHRALLVAIPVVALPLAAWLGMPRLSATPKKAGPEMCVAERGTFVHDVTEHGDVESADNVEVRCEVESYGGGVMILWIIPEGTYVEPVPDWEPEEPGEEPPDLLVKLDSSALKDRLVQQQITCNTSEALLIQAENNLETALISREEYLEGTYLQASQKLEGNISLAEEELIRAEQYLSDSEILHGKGFISDRKLRADEFDVQGKKIDLARARTAKDVLDKYTRPKRLLDLEAQVSVAEAGLESRRHSHHINLEKLAEIEEQIAKCTIRAPQAGQVVYANVTDYGGGQQIVIEEGTKVRQRQVIIRLPDPRNMQVKAKINEARVSLLEQGMPAGVELDAFPDVQLAGTVKKVSEYPLPSAWYAGNVKEYEAIIKIDEVPKNMEMRPGMTAKVSIRVERIADTLQLPVQAVFEHGRKHFCVLRNGRGYEAREVVIGPTNDKEVVIAKGLEEGEPVVLKAASVRDDLDLPEIERQPKPDRDTAAADPGVLVGGT